MDRATILNDYIQKIVAAGQPQAIVLFGSEANFAATDESDFDFLIIEQSAGTPR